MAWKNVQYENGKYRTSEGGGGGASNFADLDDVSFNNIQNGQVPKYNSTTQKWENANESGGGGTVTDVQVDGVSVVNQQGVAEIETPNADGIEYDNQQSGLQATNMQDAIDELAQGSGYAHHYSTTEQVVGTWIDGKPLYQKTINFGALPNATSKSVNHNILSMDYIVSASGIAYNENNSYFPIPFVNDQSYDSQLLLMLSKTEITIRTSVNRTTYTKCYITIQYTKTTDV